MVVDGREPEVSPGAHLAGLDDELDLVAVAGRLGYQAQHGVLGVGHRRRSCHAAILALE